MKISKSTGLRIVTELSDIIHQRINLIDEKGYIIASSDPKRIGTVHEGALQIIQERLQELIIHSDSEWEGSRAGLNLPLEMEGRCIGVVGISGEYTRIEKYGQIIKKMTEILLLNEELQEQKRRRRNIRSNLLREWVVEGADVDNPEFRARAASMEIDLEKERRVLVMGGGETHPDLTYWDRLERVLSRAAEYWEAEPLMFDWGTEYILLVPEQTDERLRFLCGQMIRSVDREMGASVYIGVDSLSSGGAGMREAYRRAEKAYKSASSMGKREAVFYEDLSLEIFIHEVPKSLRREFVRKIFKNCTETQIQKNAEILRTLYACNSSIGAASESLFMHKNTLQYKLNRLAEKTGINPRSPRGTALYYLAISFYELEKE